MKRIQRANDKEELIKELTSERVGVFKEIWKLLVFAALVGIKNDVRLPLKAVEPGKGIDQSTFGNGSSWPGLLYLITLVETEKSESLADSQTADDERVAVFQEYANGGLKVMQDFFTGRPIDLDGLLVFFETQIGDSAEALDLDLMI
jgi:dnd system-associated protein 4